MKVLVACEFSGVVRSAFRARGHDAWSCDLLPAEDGSPYHLQCDVTGTLDDGWDLIIEFPGKLRNIGGKTGPALIRACNALAARTKIAALTEAQKHSHENPLELD